MKTFRESLIITRNYKILEQLVTDIELSGLDSNKFLDWYLEEGLHLQKHNLLKEGFTQALEEGIWSNIAGRWSHGKESGQGLAHRFPRLNKFGRQLGTATQLGGEFLGKQIGRARDAYNSFSSGIEGKPDQPAKGYTDQQMRLPFDNRGNNSQTSQDLISAAKSAVNDLSKRYNLSKDLQAAINDDRFGEQLIQLLNMLNSLKVENSIRGKLFFLSSKGLDVENLVDWFSEERLSINEGIGDWFSKAKNWLGSQWQNVKHAWNSWGEGDKNVAKQKNRDAVSRAIKSLSLLKQKYGDSIDQEFSGVLDTVLSKVNAAQTEPQAQAQTEPQAQAQTEPQAQSQTEPFTYTDPAKDTSNLGGGGVDYAGASGGNHGVFQDVGKYQTLREPKKPVDPVTKKFVARDPSFGRTPPTNIGLNQNSFSINTSTEHKEGNDFLESITPKENKFSWFGY